MAQTPDRSQLSRLLGDYLELRGDDKLDEAEALRARHPELDQALAVGLDVAGVLDDLYSDAATEDPLPERIGDYRIIREIGRGGMGVVYEAEQESMQRPVALKVLTPSLTSAARAVKRFQREARSAGRLHHTNIVPVYGMGRDGGHWYYAMELVRGRALSEVLHDLRMRAPAHPSESGLAAFSGSRQSGEPEPAESSHVGGAWFRRIAEVFAGVADALHTVHEEGVVHRDIKPSNLLLDADGTLMIVDFGLAHLDQPGPSMTLTGDLVGTPAYMSPEQAMARRVTLDHRSDIYSLGATLYETLTLRPPFEGSSLQELCSQIITKDPALPRRVDARVPRDLETIVLKAMEKDRDKRYQRAADLAADLRRFAAGAAIGARRVGIVERAWRKVKRHKAVASLVAALVLALSTGGVLATRAADQDAVLRDRTYRDLVAAAEAFYGEDSPDRQGYRSWAGETEEKTEGQQLGDEVLARAMELLPERPEAFVIRALHRHAPTSERQAAVDAAVRRGLSPVAAQLLRALIGLSNQRLLRVPQSVRDARPETALECLVQGLVIVRAHGSRQDNTTIALPALEAAIERSPAGSLMSNLAHRACATVYERLKEFQKALLHVERLRESQKDDVHMRIWLAGLWDRLGQPKHAEQEFAAALADLQAADAETWRDAARALQHSRRFDWVQTLADAAVARCGDSVGLRKTLSTLMAAFQSYLRKTPESEVAYRASLAHLDAALAIEPRSIRLRRSKIGRLLRQREANHEAILALCDEILAIDPRDFGARLRKKWQYFSCKRYAESAAVAREMIEVHSEHERVFELYGHLARMHLRMGQHAEAIAVCDEALRRRPGSARQRWDVGVVHHWRGYALLHREKYAAALDAFDRRDAMIQDHPPGHFMWAFAEDMVYARGMALTRLQRAAEVVDYLRASLERYGRSERIHDVLVFNLRVLERPLELRAEYRRWAGLPHNRTNALAWNNLAWSHVDPALPEALRDPTEGLVLARKAVALAKKPDPTLLDTLGHALFYSGQIEDAVATQVRARAKLGDGRSELRDSIDEGLARFVLRAPLERAKATLLPHGKPAWWAKVYARLGWSETSRGNRDAGILAAQRAVGLCPDDRAVHVRLAIRLRNAGRYVEAVQAYRRAIDIVAEHGGPRGDEDLADHPNDKWLAETEALAAAESRHTGK